MDKAATHLTSEVFRLAVQNASDHIVITDADGFVLYANKAVERITGYSLEETIGTKAGKLWGGLMPPEYYKNLWHIIKEEKKILESEIKNRRKNGEIYDAQVRISPVLDEQKNILFFVGIEIDITEHKKLDDAKTEFVSLASHQLKTPLSAINWYTEMLRDGDAGPVNVEQDKFLGEVYSASKRMIDLVNSLLNVSRIDIGTLAVKPIPQDISLICADVQKELQHQIDEKHISVVFNCPQKPLISIVDDKITRIVFQNLISNAVKYTPENGSIVIELKKENGEFIFSVKDSGYGIPEKEKGNIFGKFYRATNVQKYDVEGSGLGLYIVKSALDQSGGKIWFVSKEGEGTTFFVSIPESGMKIKEGNRTLS